MSDKTTDTDTINDPDYEEFVAFKRAKEEAKAKAEIEAKARIEAAERARVEYEAKKPRKGYVCRVVRGKKVPLGTEGTCVWLGETKYGLRVGLKVEGQAETVWTAAGNVEAVRPDEAFTAAVDAAKSAETEKLEQLGGETGILGKTLKVTSGRNAGYTGRVFWCRGTRLGLRCRPGAQPCWEYVGRCEAAA